MKRTRAYTLSDDVIAILSRKPNKSQYVERAVRKFSREEEEFDIRDVPTRALMWALSQRDDCPQSIKAIILDMMWSE